MADKVYDYGCAMLYVDFPERSSFQDLIAKEDLADNGIEMEPHITLLYGFHHNDTIIFDIGHILSKYTFRTVITTGVGLFENEHSDVLKLEVDDRVLTQINKELQLYPNSSTYSSYAAHLTLAYLKPGTGHKYLKLFKELGLGRCYLKPSHIVYSYPEEGTNKKIDMPIKIQKEELREFVKDNLKKKIKNKIKKYVFEKESGGKYSHINFTPPESVAKAASRGLEYREKNNGKGGLSNKQASKQGIGSGVQRAVNLKNRTQVSPETINRMVSFFARHEKNKNVEAGEQPWEDKGKIAWELWGGDAGKSWANKIKAQMDAADNKSKNETTYLKESFESVLDVDTLFKRYKEVEIKAHYYHLITKSYSKHTVVGDFYQKLVVLTDSLIESITSTGIKNLSSSLNISITVHEDFQKCLLEFSNFVRSCIEYEIEESIKDVFIQTEKLIKKTLYLMNRT